MRPKGSTLRDLFQSTLRRNAPRVALRTDAGDLTYRELDRESSRLANALAARGIGAGDRVALLLRNGAEYVAADLAIIKLGAVKVPLNEMLSEEDVAYMLGHSGARVLIAHTSFAGLLERARGALDPAPQGIAVRDDGPPPEGFELYDEVTSRASDRAPEARVEPQQPGLILYTGGTTGRSKGVLHTQDALAVNMLIHVVAGEIRPDDHLLLNTPLPHSAGFHLQAALLQGATTTVTRFFAPDAVLRAIEKQGVTWTFMVPTMIYRTLDALEAMGGDPDLSGLRTVLYGAAPITKARLSEALERFGPVFLQLYGQSECPNYITALSKPDHLREELLGSCGQPVIGTEVAIADEKGRFLPEGEVGEIRVRSPYTLDCYYRAPELTRKAYRGEWLATGDVGYRIESDHLFLVDRAKDMIISGGMNVYTSDVENAIQEFDGVRQVAVIGVPHKDWGEAVHAVVVAGDGFSADALTDFCKQRLAKYKVPKSVEVVDSIPVTPYGKVDKKLLRSRAWAGQERQIH